MSATLFDSIARIARHEVQARAVAAVGTVSDVMRNPGATPDHAVNVQLRESGIVLPRVPIAVGALGFAASPNVGDLVVVVFLDGDLHAPVVVGRLYHSDLTPPEHAEGEIVLRVPAGASSPAWEIVLSEQNSSLTVSNAGEIRLELTEERARVKVGDSEVDVSSQGGGRIEMKAADGCSVLITQSDITIEAQTSVSIKATDIELKATGNMTIRGAKVELN
ncbi:MAG TPA: phage baseplate assembly protein V [Longimicrobiales bacterium]